ncbi:Glu/Leu/Phe/Val dehydrogenase family protein [Saccharothrix coeruleofusca]|uniref:Leucine dehydrogenase n=1 Tax=Saccharothrix coeruleofusca TaxID=33919 RepID=A0A918EHC5_9PSEU|nr:Glu/Leu/Phe/Val dehydrogenase family protein [Saccharothrix coeruleofusca]GGP87863.1 leucine dehydrogenase [Saccharothrix coeruleofusca]
MTAPVPAHRPAAAAARPLTAERVRIERGRRSGQTVIVSVDSTRLGPALGGCRVKTYPSWRDGLDDVLRLSAAMTEKAALAGLDHGGGKTVVALDGSTSADWTGARRADLLADVAEVVEGFGGDYIIGPDIGTSPEDMALLWSGTRHVLCRPESAGGSGDSSIPTALGVTSAIEAVCAHLWAGRDLSTLRFSLIGLGHVGAVVGDWLAARGAELTVSDIDPRHRALAERWRATWVTPREALLREVDVVVPCAVGGILTPDSVARLRCRAVVGAANNQLDHASTADLLHERGVLWAPDTIVSAGGIIASVARELHGATRVEAERRVRGIGDRLAGVLADANTRGTTPLRAARDLVDRRLRNSSGERPGGPAVGWPQAAAAPDRP